MKPPGVMNLGVRRLCVLVASVRRGAPSNASRDGSPDAFPTTFPTIVS